MHRGYSLVMRFTQGSLLYNYFKYRAFLIEKRTLTETLTKFTAGANLFTCLNNGRGVVVQLYNFLATPLLAA